MSLHSRSSFFLAALAATSALAGCTYDSNGEPFITEQQPAARTPAAGRGDGASTRTLRGTVTSEEGRPIAGAVLTVGDALAVVSDGEGAFALEGLPLDGEVIVLVSAGHYESLEVSVDPRLLELNPKLKYAAIPWPPPAVKKGLTWVKALHDNTKGQDQVSCHDYTIVGGPGPSPTPTRSCDPYVGDTACNLSRPILCIKPDGSASNGHPWSFYNGWSKGNIGITHPIVGSTMTSLVVANAMCVAEFGAGWRMASHHDGLGGGGWQWRGFGNINTLYAVQEPGHTLDHRFWVYILEGGSFNPWDPTNPDNPSDQRTGGITAQLATAGNCWN